MTSWFSLRGISERKHETSRDGRLPRQPLSRRKRRTNPRLEPLEDRALLSVVTNTADSGPGSLRDAISTATNGTIISFDPSLAGQKIDLSTVGDAPDGPSALLITNSITI